MAIYILYEYCFTNVIILLLSISDTVFPVSYKNNDRGVLHWFCFLLFLFQSFFVFKIFKSQERGSRSAGKNGWYMFFKIGVFFNFAIFTVKGMCWSPFLFKLQAWGTATLLKDTPSQVFSCESCEIFKNIFFTEHLQWLPLKSTNWWLDEQWIKNKNILFSTLIGARILPPTALLLRAFEADRFSPFG